MRVVIYSNTTATPMLFEVDETELKVAQEVGGLYLHGWLLKTLEPADPKEHKEPYSIPVSGWFASDVTDEEYDDLVHLVKHSHNLRAEAEQEYKNKRAAIQENLQLMTASWKRGIDAIRSKNGS